MGDRYVVGFRASDQTPNEQVIYLYSHWGGSEQHQSIAQAIIAAQPRWNDADYATRIATSSLIGEDWRHETGYGLSVGSFCGPDYASIHIVDWASQTVLVTPLAAHFSAPRIADAEPVPFADFLATAEARDKALYDDAPLVDL